MTLARFLLAALVLTVSVLPAAAQTPATAARADKSPVLRGIYAHMPAELNITEEQKAAIHAKVTERDAELKAWDARHQPRLVEVEAAIKTARESGDKQALSVAAKEHTTLRQQRHAIGQRYEPQIESVLTPEQQLRWIAYTAYDRGAARPFRNLKLTETQTAQVRERFFNAAAELKAADDKARTAIIKRLGDAAEAEILTADQRAALAQEREAATRPKPTR